MQSTMNVGIVMLIKLPNRVEHRARLLRRRCAVKINQRMPMCLLAKNWEILAKSSPINGLGGDSVHALICSHPLAGASAFAIGVNPDEP